MDLGKRLRQARLERGLSQRQLCGDTVTRNMISLIENGSAVPSLDTLMLLAERLEKPVSYFLDEQTVRSPNQKIIEDARCAYENGEWSAVLGVLENYQKPDPVFDAEEALLEVLVMLELAREAIAGGKELYAQELLRRAEAAGKRTPYYTPELHRDYLLLLGQLVSVQLPVDDRELLLRAREALGEADFHRAAQYLEAAEDRAAPQWNLLRGRAYLGLKDYENAAGCYQRALDAAPRICAEALEHCYREMENYKEAYRYACMLRELE